MSDYVCLLVTVLYESEGILLTCALKAHADLLPHGDDEAWWADPDVRAKVHELLPLHVRSCGPVVQLDPLFEVVVADPRVGEGSTPDGGAVALPCRRRDRGADDVPRARARDTVYECGSDARQADAERARLRTREGGAEARRGVGAMTAPCPKCGDYMRHVHETAHGIEGTHMAGTERYECRGCGEVYYKTEGEKHGLKFILD